MWWWGSNGGLEAQGPRPYCARYSPTRVVRHHPPTPLACPSTALPPLPSPPLSRAEATGGTQGPVGGISAGTRDLGVGRRRGQPGPTTGASGEEGRVSRGARCTPLPLSVPPAQESSLPTFCCPRHSTPPPLHVFCPVCSAPAFLVSPGGGVSWLFAGLSQLPLSLVLLPPPVLSSSTLRANLEVLLASRSIPWRTRVSRRSGGASRARILSTVSSLHSLRILGCRGLPGGTCLSLFPEALGVSVHCLLFRAWQRPAHCSPHPTPGALWLELCLSVCLPVCPGSPACPVSLPDALSASQERCHPCSRPCLSTLPTPSSAW